MAHVIKDSTVMVESNNNRVISGMLTGELGWTVPWALARDKEGGLWLHPDYFIKPNPGGATDLLVKKDRDGFLVDTRYTTPTYEPYSIKKSSVDWFGFLPVKLLVTGKQVDIPGLLRRVNKAALEFAKWHKLVEQTKSLADSLSQPPENLKDLDTPRHIKAGRLLKLSFKRSSRRAEKYNRALMEYRRACKDYALALREVSNDAGRDA